MQPIAFRPPRSAKQCCDLLKSAGQPELLLRYVVILLSSCLVNKAYDAVTVDSNNVNDNNNCIDPWVETISACP